MSLLRPGITGFGSNQTVDFRVFKQAVHAAARHIGANITSTRIADDVAPNFHQIDLRTGDREISVICNRYFPIVACVESPVTMSGICPIDLADVSEALVGFDFEVAHVTELKRAITSEDIKLLLDEERRQLKYWKTKSIGDLVFNWWD